MKSLELSALGLEQMSLEETKQTNGGILPLLALAVVAIIAQTCVQVNIENGDGDQHVGDEHGSGDENEAHLELSPC